MKIFYHNDSDGRCAAHVVDIFAPPRVKLVNSFVEMNFDKDFPLDTISPNETVYIVDYSIDTKDMDKLLDITPNVHWVDHHQSSLEKYKTYPKYINGLRYNGLAGCVLTWIYLRYGDPRPHKDPSELEWEVPEYIRLIGDYDTWTFKYGNKSLHFYFGLQAEDTNPKSQIWKDLRSDHTIGVIEHRGKIICDYRDMFYKEYLKAYGYETTFEGHSAIVLNAGQVGSTVFDSVRGKYDIMISMVWNGKLWMMSLYSTTIDVAVLAQKYGGGGHKGASGFSTKNLPFTITSN